MKTELLLRLLNRIKLFFSRIYRKSSLIKNNSFEIKLHFIDSQKKKRKTKQLAYKHQNDTQRFKNLTSFLVTK